MKKKGKDEPKLWVTVLKLVLIAVALIGGVGLALYFAQSLATSDPTGKQDPWGVIKDSPTRMKR